MKPEEHAHQWGIARRDSGGRLLEQCAVCGVIRAAGTGAAPVIRHTHDWLYNDEDGETFRRCKICDEVQRLDSTDGSYMIIRPPLSRPSKKSLSTGRGPHDTVESHGGIVDYNPFTEMVETRDGSQFTLEALIAANPGVRSADVKGKLNELHRESLRASLTKDERVKREKALEQAKLEKVKRVADRLLSAGASMEDVAAAFAKLGEAMGGGVSGNTSAKKWTSEDALTLILEEIKHAPDPMKAAGKWLTKVTNAITGVIRDIDDEHE